jgi:hypothetical protein
MKQKFLQKKIWRISLILIPLALALVISLKIADALCVQPPEEGNWVNTDPNTRSLTRIQLRFVCQDQIHNGQPYPPGPPWYVHVWGKCHPTDCDWGEVGAHRIGPGHIYAFYNQGFAKRYVYAKMSQYRPGQLWVWTWTDFTDPNRPDYGVHNWFRKQ